MIASLLDRVVNPKQLVDNGTYKADILISRSGTKGPDTRAREFNPFTV